MIDKFKTKFSNFLKTDFRNFLIVLIVLINSKTCFMSFGASARVKIIVLAFSLIFFGILFLLTIDFKAIKEPILNKDAKTFFIRIKDYLLRPDTFSIALLILFDLITILISFKKPSFNINPYVGTTGVLLMAFFVTQFIDIKTFLKYLGRVVFVVSCIGIFFYFVLAITDVPLYTSVFESSRNTYESFLYLFNINFGTERSVFSRMFSVFWEPGVFANFLLLSLIYEFFVNDKTEWEKVAVYIVCLFLTKSTAGYLVMLIIFACLVLKHLKGKTLVFSSFALIGATFALYAFSDQIFNFLGKIFPQVFSKISENSTSVITRLESPLYFLKVYLKGPIFGLGLDGSMKEYLNAISDISVDSATSTFGYLIASFGLAGIIFTVFVLIGFFKFNSDKLNVPTRLLLTLALLLMTNTETQTEILAFMCIFVMSIKQLSKYRFEGNKLEQENKNNLLYLMLSKKTNGKFAVNLTGSVILKLLFIFTGFLTVPIFSKYFANDSLYGSWLSIVSILATIISLDFGITDGVKNKIIEARHKKDQELIRGYISSSYLMLSIISVVFVSAFIVLSLVIDWNGFLNIPENIVPPNIVRQSMIVIAIAIGFEIILRNVVSIFSAYERIVLANSLTLFTNVGLISFALIFRNTSIDKIQLMSFIYFIMINLPLLVATIYCFVKFIPSERPSYKFIKKTFCKSITNIGLAFLAVQICNLVLWGFNKMLISSAYSPVYVVYFEKYYKIFSTIVSLFMVVQPTLWVYIAKAKEEKKYDRIKKLTKFSLLCSSFLAVGSILAGLLCQPLFDLWLGNDSIVVKFSDVFPFVLYGVLMSYMSTMFLLCYSTTTIKILSIVAIVIAIIKIPLFYLITSINKETDWIFVMWLNVILIVPYFIGPTSELIIRFRKTRKAIKNENI